MTSETKSRATRPNKAPAPPPRPSSDAAGSRPALIAAGFYILTQGSNVRIEQADERPSNQPAEGEPTIQIEGPYHSKEAADRRLAAKLEGSTARRARLSKRGDE